MSEMTKKDIENIIPHRDPFLLIDEILEIEPGKRIKGVKHVSEEEYYFKGHFPGNPIMPGVLQVETIAQAGAVAVLILPENKGKLVLFAGIDKARFKKMVKPGDDLIIEVEIESFRRNIGKGKGRATVDGKLACAADIMFALG
ncbi:MAG: 3-hydroxyacyl-ACP dehydratase FabZ [Actinobacteria bacterium]|jgi:3-hydroxyacyl-[acyl-carrier-protein] dehydratase|nr:3-hydroxyacyl-ACP dehydratase FabZ [Actinomycetota bacterium]